MTLNFSCFSKLSAQASLASLVVGVVVAGGLMPLPLLLLLLLLFSPVLLLLLSGLPLLLPSLQTRAWSSQSLC